MRVGEVIGTVTLSTRVADLPPGNLLLVRPLDLDAIGAGAGAAAEPVVAFDQLSAGLGARVSLSEGREAAMPFHPTPVPLDVYCAAILDTVYAVPLH
jgi:microcompartment protein CcmK/EutM